MNNTTANVAIAGRSFQFKGHMAMIGANAMWGLMSPVAKLAMAAGTVTPLLITDCRIIGAALLFWLTSFFTGREHVPFKDLMHLAGAGVLGVVLNQGCFIFGVGYTSPAEASLISTTMPMWVMILAALILKEPITGKKVAGIVTGAAGAVMLVTGGGGLRDAQGSNPLLGDLLVTGSQLSYALYLTLYKNFINKYSLVTLMKWMFTFACIGVLFTSGTIADTEWSAITLPEVAGVAYVVLFGTFFSYICMLVGQKTLRPTLVSMYNYVQPTVAMAVSVTLGLDSFTWLKSIAVVFIFTGVWMVTKSKARQPD